jgi:hypothetical protein
MSLVVNDLIKEMTRAAGGVLAKESRRTRAAIAGVLADQKAAMEAIVAARMAGEIDDAEMDRQIRSERLAFKSGLAMARVAGKSAAHKAADAAFAVFAKALRAAI